jgi:hypothetical protein
MRENGQHDNRYISQLLMDNGPLGGDMAGDDGLNIRMVDVAAWDWR